MAKQERVLGPTLCLLFTSNISKLCHVRLREDTNNEFERVITNLREVINTITNWTKK